MEDSVGKRRAELDKELRERCVHMATGSNNALEDVVKLADKIYKYIKTGETK